jgi:cation:H+ antiporter
MADWLSILGGLVVLIASANLLVRGAACIALALGISPMVVGLTLVAFGTSAPELMVSLEAALDGRGGLALANVVGSNVINIGVILGLSALARPIGQPWQTIVFEMRWLLAVTLLFPLAVLPFDGVTRGHGLALVVALGLFTAALIARERRATAPLRSADALPAAARRGAEGMAIDVALVVVGLLGLKVGGDWLVGGAVNLARSLAVSETLIGLTVVALGTSLPELATSVVAARRKEAELALGNVIGSNLFNLCGVLGVASLVAPFPIVWRETALSVGAMVVFAVALHVALKRGSFIGIGRGEGAVLLVLYAAYLGAELFAA